MFKKGSARLLLMIISLALAILACDWFPLDWSQWDFGKPVEGADRESAYPTNSVGESDGAMGPPIPWQVESCSAISEVKITLTDFTEETIDAEGGTECAYSYRITNEGNQPLILVYYDHFFYGENPPPNEYEFGWNLTSPVQPGESRTLESFSSTYPKQPLYQDQVISLAVIYESPDCDWLTAGGIHREILEIAVEEPIQAPCALVSPASDPGAAPDLGEGLIGD